MVHVGCGDEFDLSPIVRSLEEHRPIRPSTRRNVPYEPDAFPESSSSWLGLTSLRRGAIWWAIRVSASDVAAARRGSWGLAIAEAEKAKELVLDLCALVTVANLGLIGQIAGGTRGCVVAQTAFERLQHLADAVAKEQTDSKGVMLLATTARWRPWRPPRKTSSVAPSTWPSPRHGPRQTRRSTVSQGRRDGPVTPGADCGAVGRPKPGLLSPRGRSREPCSGPTTCAGRPRTDRLPDGSRVDSVGAVRTAS